MKKGFILIFLFFPFVMQAQQMKITGTAYDADTRNKLKLVFVNNKLTKRSGTATESIVKRTGFVVKLEYI